MEPRKLGNIALLGLAFALGGSSLAAAACDSAVLQKLLERGFSREDILAVCGGAPPTPAAAAPAPAQPAPGMPPGMPAAVPQPPAAAPAATAPMGQPGLPAGAETRAAETNRIAPELVGNWTGKWEPLGWGMRMTLSGDGSYTLYVEVAPGTFTNQTGHWWVENAMFAMRPDSVLAGPGMLPLPPQTEFHTYQLDAARGGLVIKSSMGDIRLTRV